MFSLFELGLFDSLGGSIDACVPGLNFVNAAEPAPSDLFQHWVILQIIHFFHFNELIPPNFDLLNFSQVFYWMQSDFFLVVLDFPIFGFMSFILYLGYDFLS